MNRKFYLAAFLAALFMMFAGCVSVSAAQTTTYKGKNYARVYNYDYYVQHVHPEFAGRSGADVIKYFVTTGMAKGEQASAEFDPKSYRRGVRNLRRKYNKNYKNYYLHYMSEGYKNSFYRKRATGIQTITKPETVYKGFNYAKVYNFNYYIERYALKSKYWDDDISAIKYFVTVGLPKKQQGIATFNVESYRLSNPEIRQSYYTDYVSIAQYYCKHPNKYGGETGVTTLKKPITSFKGVNLKKVFDYKYYTTHNSAAAKFSPSQANDDASAIRHFATVGIFQGKIAKAGVSAKSSNYKKAKSALTGVVPNAGSSIYTKALQYDSDTKYLILVDRSAYLVYVFSGSRDNGWILTQRFPCVTGARSTPTVTGVFKIQDRGLYFWTGSNRCWYWTRFHGNYLFHSQIYDGSSSPRRLVSAVMSASASHGCVRLYLSHAKWIYDNIPRGTKVVIYN